MSIVEPRIDTLLDKTDEDKYLLCAIASKRARDINDEMKMAASRAIASLVSDEELTPRYILPEAFDRRVGPAVARAVAEAAVRSGVARLPLPDAQA